MNYYIDFDNTIFDTVSFHDDLVKILLKNNVSKEYIDNYYKDHGVNPLDLVKSLNNNRINELVEKLFKKAHKYLYKDAIKFLKNKSFNNYILYTYGYLDYQNKKIDNCDIKKYFDEIIITDNNKTELDIDYKNGIFFDDNVDVIKELLKKDVYKIYRVKRNNNVHSETKLSNNKVIDIYNMNEIKD